jgi:chlorite dismutase
MATEDDLVSGEPESSLNHFCVFALTDDYWRLSEEERSDLQVAWVEKMADVAEGVRHYRTPPTRVGTDFILWCAVRHKENSDPQKFFDAYARALRPFRRYVSMVDVLWGFTRATQYRGARDAGRIDPFSSDILPYLIAYPFSKTAEWYLIHQPGRQSMMNEHIKIGRTYAGISQLLLYSTGLQDHEFVVVYESDDLPRFSELVRELRATAARPYTLLDAPVHVATHAPADQPTEIWP